MASSYDVASSCENARVDDIRARASRKMILRYHFRKNWLRYVNCLLLCLCIGELVYIQHLGKGLARVSNDPYDIRFGELTYKSPELWDDAHQTFLRSAYPVPVHSHNDYERNIPLFDGIGSGCISVEADVHLRSSNLYVGHSSLGLSSKKTLKSLYLEPLQRMIKTQNEGLKDGWRGLFDKAPYQTLTLLIDFKTSGAKTFAELDRQLQPLRDMDYLTYWNGTARITRPLTIVVSGKAPFESVIGMNSKHRDIFWDAKLESLVSTEDNFNTNPPTYRFNKSNSYFASTKFQNAKLFRSNYDSGLDVLPQRERDLTATQIEQAESRGLLARYWDTPSEPPNVRDIAWRVLIDNEIGLLNMDDLESFSIREMMELCLVNREFHHFGMEAIFESDILKDAVYWDPVRGTKVFYEKVVEDEGFAYPCLLDGYNDSSDDEDDGLPRYFRAQSTPDILADSVESEYILSNEFCIKHLTAWTLGKIGGKPPTRDHITLRVIAERMNQYRLDQDPSANVTLENSVRVVCEVAVKYGYIYDRRDFFVGGISDMDDIAPWSLDETCAVIRDAMIGLAIYLNEPEVLKKVLSKEQKVACPHHIGDRSGKDHFDIPDEFVCTAPYTPWLPHIESITSNRKSEFRVPECGRSLLRLANPVKLAAQMNNMKCASILLDSLSDHSKEQDFVRQEIIAESKETEKLDWLRLAIDSGPSLTEYNIAFPALDLELEWFKRTDYSGRKGAAIELSKILDKTTSVEVFDVVYEAIMEGFIEREGVWWTKKSFRHHYGAHSLESWGTARIHRAVLHDCMPLVKRLVEMGHHLGATKPFIYPGDGMYDEEEMVREYGMAKTLVDSEKPRDISLQLATKRGDLEMVELLLDIGAEANRKNVRTAIRVAMEQENLPILQEDVEAEA
ncbi:altered inheritance of mitochondria 6 [Fusarium longipes]|uniref:Altered inheritance of mitochondria protein 6 n=1 Tax=Fusarium longipes TaxID=694270 RepID=A0A395SG39_9HYPO|nr:altered inheritance of mitochondria 6 [Fusarium longipes]